MPRNTGGHVYLIALLYLIPVLFEVPISYCIDCQNVSESTSHYMQKLALQILETELSIG